MSDKVNNLELWERVEKTDPNHTKKANVGGNQITAIAPQYQILNATREFGSYGTAWGFESIEHDYELAAKFNVVVMKAIFYYPGGSFPITSSIKMYRDNAMTKVDADFAKKLETDTLTKALSKLGFNADVFMGRYDDVKYLDAVTKEFAPKKEKVETPTKKSVEAIIEAATDKQTLNAWREWITKFDLGDIAQAKAETFK